jgi:hypothetical protein
LHHCELRLPWAQDSSPQECHEEPCEM